MISVLFAARNSIYKTIPDLDVWDEDRDALKWPGGNPGIFHPPCRLWSMLRRFSTAPESEKQLALWSVSKVRQNGGILEHPAFSELWKVAALPSCGRRDRFGFSYGLDQYWFGHPCRKRTWLYICGLTVADLPIHPIRLVSEYRSSFHTKKYFARERSYRSATPMEFANWLIETAKLIP
jgi:hypothetical protein